MSAITTSPARASRRSGRSKLFALVAAVVAAFLLSACHFLGSGTLTSANGQDNATFALNVNCTFGYETGMVTYIDNGRPYRVSVHATATQASLRAACGTVQTDGPHTEYFNGTYAPLDPRIPGGLFYLTVSQGGTSLGGGGSFSIKFLTGGYTGYQNSGPVKTGNIVKLN